MEHLLDDLTKNIKTIIASGKDNLDMLNETKPSIEKEIKQTRLAINGYLDKLERELLVKVLYNTFGTSRDVHHRAG
jgi:hypothetical protein